MNEQLINYINSRRGAGVDDAAIRAELLGAGWQEATVNQFLGGGVQVNQAPIQNSVNPNVAYQQPTKRKGMPVWLIVILATLLPFIAIVGILAAVIMANLNTARGKATQAKIKSDMEIIRTQSQFFYDDNNFSYGEHSVSTSCLEPSPNSLFTDNFIQEALKDTVRTSQKLSHNSVKCVAHNDSFVVVAPLDENLYWCIDDRGDAREIHTPINDTTTECPVN